MTGEAGRPTVLIVDGEPDVAESLAAKVRPEYEARVIADASEAVARLDETVDAVVCDRRIPDAYGVELLEAVSDCDREYVLVMTTAVDPDLNILEADFDDFLTKPVERDALVSTLDKHLDSQVAEARLEDLFETLAAIERLEAEHPPAKLAENDEYETLVERVERLRGELGNSDADFYELVETHRDLNRE